MSNRTSISLSIEDQAAIDKLKKEFFYDKSYSDLYRALIRLGITQMEKKGKK